jgi:hypothetical protein
VRVFSMCAYVREGRGGGGGGWRGGGGRERKKFVSVFVCVYARVSAYMCVCALTVRLH